MFLYLYSVLRELLHTKKHVQTNAITSHGAASSKNVLLFPRGKASSCKLHDILQRDGESLRIKSRGTIVILHNFLIETLRHYARIKMRSELENTDLHMNHLDCKIVSQKSCVQLLTQAQFKGEKVCSKCASMCLSYCKSRELLDLCALLKILRFL